MGDDDLRRVWWFAAVACLAIWTGPWWIEGRDAHVQIHDNLDASAVLAPLHRSALFFAPDDAVVPQILGGIPRGTLGSELFVVNLAFWALPAFEAYVLVQVALRVVGLAGMALLLFELLPPRAGARDAMVPIGAAAVFALLPHYARAGASVSGLPLTLWALMGVVRRRDRIWHWVVLAALPFFQSLLVAPVFLLAGAGVAWLVHALGTRRPHLRWLAAMLVAVAAHLLVEHRLVSMLLLSDHVSHRVEIDPVPLDLAGALGRAWTNFVAGQEHVRTLHAPIVFVAIGLALGALAMRRPEGGARLAGRLSGVVAAAGAISLAYGLWAWGAVRPLRDALGPLAQVQWDRIHWLHPLLWVVAFALALDIVRRVVPAGRIVAFALLAAQAAVLVRAGEAYAERRAGHPSWAEFHAERQFGAIRAFIGRDPSRYRVVSLGLHPAVALHNGFYCADGYHYDYPLAYKHRFRRAIAGELAKDPDLAAYFDRWGSRCYLLSAELGKSWLVTKRTRRSIHDLAVDAGALADLGVAYVLAALPIDEPAAAGLRLVHVFDDDASAWRIHLYALEPATSPPEPGTARDVETGPVSP